MYHRPDTPLLQKLACELLPVLVSWIREILDQEFCLAALLLSALPT